MFPDFRGSPYWWFAFGFASSTSVCLVFYFFSSLADPQTDLWYLAFGVVFRVFVCKFTLGFVILSDLCCLYITFVSYIYMGFANLDQQKV